jgi:isopenicillin N synthase-like dioxygenase
MSASSSSSPSAAGAATAEGIPIIDLRAFREGTPAQRADVVRAFDDAFRTVGFCCVENYDDSGRGLPEAAVQSLRHEAMRWFTELTPEAKQTAYADGMVGYIGPGLENVAASTGDHSNAPDLVESLNFPGCACARFS